MIKFTKIIEMKFSDTMNSVDVGPTLEVAYRSRKKSILAEEDSRKRKDSRKGKGSRKGYPYIFTGRNRENFVGVTLAVAKRVYKKSIWRSIETAITVQSFT